MASDTGTLGGETGAIAASGVTVDVVSWVRPSWLTDRDFWGADTELAYRQLSADNVTRAIGCAARAFVPALF